MERGVEPRHVVQEQFGGCGAVARCYVWPMGVVIRQGRGQPGGACWVFGPGPAAGAFAQKVWMKRSALPLARAQFGSVNECLMLSAWRDSANGVERNVWPLSVVRGLMATASAAQ